MIVLVAYVVNVLSGPLHIIDDAYITFRNVSNLIQHGELVFNLGERLEGFTNLLWALLLALVGSVLGTPIPQTAIVLSLLLVPLALYRLFQIGEELTGKPLLGAATALLLALNPLFLRAATNGLEAALFVVLLTELCFRVMRGQLIACGALIGLLFLTRPEGVTLLVGATLAVFVRTGNVRRAAPMVGLVMAFVAGATAFRLSYYGSVIPNSIIAKDAPLSDAPGIAMLGIKYAFRFVLVSAYLFLPLVYLVRSWRGILGLGDAQKSVLIFSLTTAVLAFAIAIRNGGDWMPNFRLLFQYAPIFATLTVTVLELSNYARDQKPVLLFGLCLWPLAMVATSLDLNRKEPWTLGDARDGFYAETADRLKGVIEPGDVISAEALGYISYRLPRNRFHDPLGLEDAHLARHGSHIACYGRIDVRYTLTQVRPAVALWHSGGRALGVSKEILQPYQIRRFGSDTGWNATYLFIREDRIQRLSPAFDDWPIVTGDKG